MKEMILRLRSPGNSIFDHSVFIPDSESAADFLGRMPWGKDYTLLAVDGVPVPQSSPMRSMNEICAACGYAYGDHDGEECPKQQGRFRRHNKQIKPAPARDPSAERDSRHIRQPAFTRTPFNPHGDFFDEWDFTFASHVESVEPAPLHPLQRAKGLR